MAASRTDPWRLLLLVTRLFGAAGALAILGLHRVSGYDDALAIATVVYVVISCGVVMRLPRAAGHPAAWLVDAAVVLGFVYASTDWRSPYYVMAISSLVLPATSLAARRAVAWGVCFTVAYVLVAIAQQRLATRDLQSAIRLETAATHIMLPLVITVLLAYAALLLDRLVAEQRRTERLAVEAERRRIAWELHDSAKQRVHAAHLLLSAVSAAGDGGASGALEQALEEVRAASADMESAVAELRTPLEDRPLHVALAERAAELQAATSASLSVRGRLPALPPVTMSHVHRIATEALSNAVRHAGARRIDVELAEREGAVTVAVTDDGRGLPEQIRPGATGLRIMRDRARTIGAALDVGHGHDGHGTRVELTLPPTDPPEVSL